MSPKKKYKIKGTKDFLIIAIACFIFCIWAIRDGWFPTEGVLKKHPQRVELSFERAGRVTEVQVEEGQEVRPGEVVAEIAATDLERAVFEAEKAYRRVREQGTEADQRKALGELREARAALEQAELKVGDQYGKNDLSVADVLEVKVREGYRVKPGETAVVIHPHDHFYPFNKSLTFLTGILFFVFMYLHWVANR
ncbi:biotin/lipoyl-binding protein [Kiritimatiella glycovorans]|uniref:Putative efflux pump membrane fusion protein n=1 Tax=Kiritimatiella glycovorans TaxID=1307763 RepID=A0A0G3ECQ1_9BACT|nr:biotin/lipoyl-binding protein [Kiritimatiella glycovorans]AKJ64281.1 putative efflux pump membrane fusion protein [Kiritimatiella glycovorans]